MYVLFLGVPIAWYLQLGIHTLQQPQAPMRLSSDLLYVCRRVTCNQRGLSAVLGWGAETKS